MKFSTLVSAAVLATSALMANAQSVTFTGENEGHKSNGYTVGGISFSDSIGSDFYVADYNERSHGMALWTGQSDASKLEMSFGNATSLSLEFGNDGPLYSHPGDRAWLEIYSGSTLVAKSSVELNRDNTMNQMISLSGFGVFDNAVFYFGDAAGNAVQVAEIVDNINLSPAVAAIPEPQTYAMLFAGLAAVRFTVRRRRRG